MILNFPESYFPNLSGDYQRDEDLLIKEIERLPVLKYFEGWIYYAFKNIAEESVFHFKEEQDTGFKGFNLIFSEERKEFLNDNWLWNSIEASFNDLLKFLPVFHMHYKSQHSYRIGKIYSYCFLFLRGVLDSKKLNKNSIEGVGLNLEVLKSNSIKKLEEVNQLILNLLKDLNFSYKDFEEELLNESVADTRDYLQTYTLINEAKFKSNFEKIYSRLVPIYLNESTTREEVRMLFSGGKKHFNNPVIWMQNPNQLNYFVASLRHRSKISNGRFYKMAEKLFVDRNNNTFKNLKNNHSTPENAYKLNLIIELF